MPAIAESFQYQNKHWIWMVFAGLAILLILAVATPNLLRSRMAADQSSRVAHGRYFQTQMEASLGASAFERKIIQTSSLQLVVADPVRASAAIHMLASQLGGYIETSEIDGQQNSPYANIVIRVPASQLENAKAEIRKLAVRVVNEKTDAKDVSKEYVDQQSRLRNLQAEETQYLAILKRVTTVKETLDVTEKLSGVRGQIDQQQAEFEGLSNQVETAAITIDLRSQANASDLDLNWQPLLRLKLAWHDGIEGVGNYVSTMVAFLFYAPTILLWMATVLATAWVGWRAFRWIARQLFSARNVVSSTPPVL